MFSLEKTTFVQEPDFNLVKPMLKSLTIALVISLALSFLLFPCIAEARVNINVTPKGASEYEEPQIIDEGKCLRLSSLWNQRARPNTKSRNLSMKEQRLMPLFRNRAMNQMMNWEMIIGLIMSSK